jgi:hypothetical protein
MNDSTTGQQQPAGDSADVETMGDQRMVIAAASYEVVFASCLSPVLVNLCAVQVFAFDARK